MRRPVHKRYDKISGLALSAAFALALAGGWAGPVSAQTMDAALALHLRRVGYDPETGLVTSPDLLPIEVIHGCGGACSPGDAHGAHKGEAVAAAHAH